MENNKMLQAAITKLEELSDKSYEDIIPFPADMISSKSEFVIYTLDPGQILSILKWGANNNIALHPVKDETELLSGIIKVKEQLYNLTIWQIGDDIVQAQLLRI